MNETHLPITGICLVAKPGNVPTGYHCIRKAHDDINRDADLMADSILGRKDRFVCITRSWPLNDIRIVGEKREFVLEDIKVINERDSLPEYYTPLYATVDTNEKGTAKRLICIKMIERQVGIKCICDIIFLYRTKRPPQFYTIIGEINGLQMCVKEGQVPSSTTTSGSDTLSKLYPNPLTGNIYQTTQHHPQTDCYNTNTLTKKTDEKEILDGIQFEINPKYLNKIRNNNNGNGNGLGLDSFKILTPYDIERQFNYGFHIERSSL